MGIEIPSLLIFDPLHSLLRLTTHPYRWIILESWGGYGRWMESNWGISHGVLSG